VGGEKSIPKMKFTRFQGDRKKKHKKDTILNNYESAKN
jgi:hypothetical protein